METWMIIIRLAQKVRTHILNPKRKTRLQGPVFQEKPNLLEDPFNTDWQDKVYMTYLD